MLLHKAFEAAGVFRVAGTVQPVADQQSDGGEAAGVLF